MAIALLTYSQSVGGIQSAESVRGDDQQQEGGQFREDITPGVPEEFGNDVRPFLPFEPAEFGGIPILLVSDVTQM